MNTTRQKIYVQFVILLTLLAVPMLVSAQIKDDTGPFETLVTTQGVFYTTVYVSDTDGNGSVDALIGLAQGEASGYSDFSCIVRFKGSGTGGNMDAHNGSGYGADVAIPIEFDKEYEIWFEFDVEASKYTPWVKGPGMTDPVKLLDEVNFRNSSYVSLNQWTAVHQTSGDDGLDVRTVGLVDSVGLYPADYYEVGIDSLEFDPAGLNEAFHPDTTTYSATFPFGTTSVNVTAVPSTRGTTVAGVGTLDVSGLSGTLNLVATADDNVTTKTFVVNWNVTDPEVDATLSSITLDTGSLSPAFSPTKTAYEVSVPYGTTEVTVTGTASSDGATVTGGGAIDVSSGSGVASIEVTSKNGAVTKTYTVTINVDPLGLTSLTIGGVTYAGAAVSADASLDLYKSTGSVTMSAATVKAYVTAAKSNDPNAFIEFGDTIQDLREGSAVIPVTVTAADLSEQVTYNIEVSLGTGVYASQRGSFGSPLQGGDIVYARILVPGNGISSDALFGLADGKANEYGNVSTIVRFNRSKTNIDIYDGNDYKTDGENLVPVQYDTVYHCWIEVSPSDTTYTVHVQSDYAATPTTIYTDAKYRYKTTNLDQWLAFSQNGASHTLDIQRVELVASVGNIPGASTNADLASIALSAGTLSPDFDPATTTYDVAVPFGTTSVEVTATPASEFAKVTGGGEVTLIAGSAADTIVVVAEDALATKSYILNFTETAETDDATLADLTVDVGTLSPAFSAAVTSYTVTVPYGTTTVNIGATPNAAGATVTGDSAIDVSGGGTAVNVVVTASGGPTKTYVVTINVEAASSDATLAFLRVNESALEPAFSPDVTTYALEIPYGSRANKIKLAYKPTDFHATVTGNGTDSLSAVLGDTVVATLQVTSADGGTNQTYTVNIRVTPPSSDATLSALTVDAGALSPAFSSSTSAYTLDVPYGTDVVNVAATATHFGATVAGDGAIDVSSGIATATVTVTAEDGSTGTYTIEMTVLPASTDATLFSLFVAEAQTFTPDFDPTVFEYEAVVPLGALTATVTAILNDDLASMTGAGVQNLDSSVNVAEVVVTAEDGVTKNTYKVTIYVGAKPKPDPVVTGTDEELTNMIQVYPNPTSSYLIVDLNDRRLVNPALVIYDAAGKRLLAREHITEKSIKVELDGLGKGMYFLRLESNDYSVTTRFVKK